THSLCLTIITPSLLTVPDLLRATPLFLVSFFFLLFFFFFLLLPPPPSSTLFPYTTLFRSALRAAIRRPAARTTRDRFPPSGSPRSEEHTSELQSHLNLVCRLLLEKKKKKKKEHNN